MSSWIEAYKYCTNIHQVEKRRDCIGRVHDETETSGWYGQSEALTWQGNASFKKRSSNLAWHLCNLIKAGCDSEHLWRTDFWTGCSRLSVTPRALAGALSMTSSSCSISRVFGRAQQFQCSFTDLYINMIEPRLDRDWRNCPAFLLSVTVWTVKILQE